jgi:NADPH:quinone reductase-like Zn-dependent oxidoreductase
MKAMVFDTFGGPEVLHLAEVAMPKPGPGQVRVKVHAAGINGIDAKIRSGAMQAVFPTALPAILGVDFAGTIDAIGDGVADVSVGDGVLGWADGPSGSYAEYTLTSQFVPKPAELTFTYAATLPTATEAAQRGLNVLDVKAGETVLINGAAGSVGTMAVQMAAARSATAIGTASEPNQDYVRSLGGIPTVYGKGLVDRVHALVPHVDAVLDVAGKGAIPDSITLRGGTDRIVTLADNAAPSLGVSFNAGTSKDRSTSDLADWADLAARGDLTTTVAGLYPLERAAEAHRLSEAGHSRGKLVLTVS